MISGFHKRRILLWAALLGFLTGLSSFGAPLEAYLHIARNHLREAPASGNIVLVAVNDRSIAQVGTWPWPRRVHAELASELDRMGAEQVAFDIDFSSESNERDDTALASSLSALRTKPLLPFDTSWIRPVARDPTIFLFHPSEAAPNSPLSMCTTTLWDSCGSFPRPRK